MNWIGSFCVTQLSGESGELFIVSENGRTGAGWTDPDLLPPRLARGWIWTC